MMVLGLDPSMTNFGWAVHDTEAVGPARCVARGRFQTDPKSMDFIDRYTYLRGCVSALCRTYSITKCGQESPVFGELYSEGLYGLYLYTIEALKGNRVDVVLFSPLQVKAHARETLKRPDKWKMLKADMVAAAKHDTGTTKPWDHNEADAYLVGRLAGRFWHYLDGDIQDDALTPSERKLFAGTHTFSRGKKAGITEKKGLIYREDDRFFCWSQID